MTLLKTDLHIHTSEDPEDLILYSATELIDMAHRLAYAVLAITNHSCVTYSEYLRDYARERGIVLIPCMEATIQG
ncbi:MAG: PHP domain-containing protein, partial [Deltaproteobacteria bacterium]|nr:PHP domain-containing protein [Deltaproteobacteria bacterium]